MKKYFLIVSVLFILEILGAIIFSLTVDYYTLETYLVPQFVVFAISVAFMTILSIQLDTKNLSSLKNSVGVNIFLIINTLSVLLLINIPMENFILQSPSFILFLFVNLGIAGMFYFVHIISAISNKVHYTIYYFISHLINLIILAISTHLILDATTAASGSGYAAVLDSYKPMYSNLFENELNQAISIIFIITFISFLLLLISIVDKSRKERYLYIFLIGYIFIFILGIVQLPIGGHYHEIGFGLPFIDGGILGSLGTYFLASIFISKLFRDSANQESMKPI